MAGVDYVTCAECGNRLFYDGNKYVRDSINDLNNTINVTCDKCVLKFKNKILNLEKHDRRKH